MTLQDQANKILVEGHADPHPQEYHETVFNRLDSAVSGLTPNTPQYETALRNELGRISNEIATPRTQLNNIVTKK